MNKIEKVIKFLAWHQSMQQFVGSVLDYRLDQVLQTEEFKAYEKLMALRELEESLVQFDAQVEQLPTELQPIGKVLKAFHEYALKGEAK